MNLQRRGWAWLQAICIAVLIHPTTLSYAFADEDGDYEWSEGAIALGTVALFAVVILAIWWKGRNKKGKKSDWPLDGSE